MDLSETIRANGLFSPSATTGEASPCLSVDSRRDVHGASLSVRGSATLRSVSGALRYTVGRVEKWGVPTAVCPLAGCYSPFTTQGTRRGKRLETNQQVNVLDGERVSYS